MKRILMLVVLLFVAGVVWGEISTNWSGVSNLHGNITFNPYNETTESYYPLEIKLQLNSVSDEGATIQREYIKNIGVGSSDPYVLDTKDNRKVFYQACPSWAKPAIKALGAEALNEDWSQ